jgi:hypothetical protein
VPLSDARKRTKLSQDFGSGAPVTWHCGFSITEPNSDGTGYQEPPGSAGYARSGKTNNVANFPAPQTAGGKTFVRNGTDIVFPNPTGPWGICRWLLFFQASSGGVPDYWLKLDSEINPKQGNTPVQVDTNTAEVTVA